MIPFDMNAVRDIEVAIEKLTRKEVCLFVGWFSPRFAKNNAQP